MLPPSDPVEISIRFFHCPKEKKANPCPSSYLRDYHKELSNFTAGRKDEYV